MLVEKIKEIANARGLEFNIGNDEWQNLLDAVDDTALPFEDKKVYLLLFSEKENRSYGKNYAVTSNNYNAIFLLAVRSKISDPNFEYKYDNHIKPLKELAREIEDNDFGICEDLTLKSFSLEGWRENYYDTNLDCVEVRLSVDYD